MIFTDCYKLKPLEGLFELVVTNRSGIIVHTYRDTNLVVSNARHIFSRCIGGDINFAINKIGFGTNNANPDPADTTISNLSPGQLVIGANPSTGPIDAYVKYTGGNSYPTPGNCEIVFSWELDYGESNGLSISEFGLLTNNFNLFARKTRGALFKNDDIRFDGTWRIAF